MVEINGISIYEIYLKLNEILKRTYLGELYLEISDIHIYLQDLADDQIEALTVFGYDLSGRYGRIKEPGKESKYLDLNETFTLKLNKDVTLDQIALLFDKHLTGED